MRAARILKALVLGLASLGVGACGSAEPTTEPDASAGAPECSTTELDWGRGGGLMLPGSDCLGCHREDSSAALVLTAAGTVFESPTCPTGVEGATVRVEDAAGAVVELTTNAVGNFFTAAPLAPPLRLSVSLGGASRAMSAQSPSGSCGACHGFESALGLVPAP